MIKRQACKYLGGHDGKEVFEAEGAGRTEFPEMGTSLACQRTREEASLPGRALRGEVTCIRGSYLKECEEGEVNFFEKLIKTVIFLNISCLIPRILCS